MRPRGQFVALRLEPLEDRQLLSYRFTDIADTTVQPFLGANFEGSASIDSQGRVAFRADWPFNVGLFISDGQSVTTVRTATFAQYLEGTSLNDQGELAVFYYFYQGGDWQIYRTDNPQTQTYIARDPRGQFGIHPSINNRDTVAFMRQAPSAAAILAGNGGPLTTIAQQDSYFKDFGDAPAINDAGTVAFLADLTSGGQGVFVNQGGTVTPVAVTGDTFAGFLTYNAAVGLNARDQVAFSAMLTGGGSGVFVGDGQQLTTVADTSGAFTSFGSTVSMNDHGRVAFVGITADNHSGIYVATHHGIKKVIAAGDYLFGAPVTGVSLFHQGLNDNGSITFVAYYANNRSAVVRADRAPRLSQVRWAGFLAVLTADSGASVLVIQDTAWLPPLSLSLVPRPASGAGDTPEIGSMFSDRSTDHPMRRAFPASWDITAAMPGIADLFTAPVVFATTGS